MEALGINRILFVFNQVFHSLTWEGNIHFFFPLYMTWVHKEPNEVTLLCEKYTECENLIIVNCEFF